MSGIITKEKKVTSSKEDYLKAIWSLSERRIEQKSEASTRDLAEYLKVSPPAVSRMLKQMKKQSLVAHTPYYGVRLTEKGRAVALKIVRRHRLLERFLADILGYNSHSVHDEAERLEHHISKEFEERIDALLGYPECCPHGSPIPNREGNFTNKI
ncbi:MAG: metal-dependent transcriptional regulator [Pyrinomonadaceae bacterium]